MISSTVKINSSAETPSKSFALSAFNASIFFSSSSFLVSSAGGPGEQADVAGVVDLKEVEDFVGFWFVSSS